MRAHKACSAEMLEVPIVTSDPVFARYGVDVLQAG